MITKNKTLQIRISDTLLKRFDKALAKEGLTRSDVVLNEVIRFIEKAEDKPSQ